MKLRIVLAMALMFVFVASTGAAFAQEPPQQPPQQPPASAQPQADPADAKQAKTKSLTGCLQKGTEAGQFTLTLKDGTMWNLESTDATIKLDDHVGHTVTVSGRAGMKAAAKAEPGEKKAETAMEHTRLNVTKITHVSDTCQK